MAVIAEIFFAIFQALPTWSKPHQARSSIFAAIALFAVILLVVVLIYKYNPKSQQGINGIYTSTSI